MLVHLFSAKKVVGPGESEPRNLLMNAEFEIITEVCTRAQDLASLSTGVHLLTSFMLLCDSQLFPVKTKSDSSTSIKFHRDLFSVTC